MYLLKDIKEYSDILGDLFLDYDGNEYVYNDSTDKIMKKDGSDSRHVNDIVWEHVDSSFIYYSDADEYLKNYDIWDEIENYRMEYGENPRNQCYLASFLYERELYDTFNEALRNIDEYEEEEEKDE